MPLYQPDVVTLWVIQADHPERTQPLLAFGSDENGECQPSPFAQAYRTGWYDEDFTEVLVGNTIEKLLEGAAVYYRTLDEQALSWVPAGDWNAIYLICGGAGAVWTHPEKRPPMPHGVVSVPSWAKMFRDLRLFESLEF